MSLRRPGVAFGCTLASALVHGAILAAFLLIAHASITPGPVLTETSIPVIFTEPPPAVMPTPSPRIGRVHRATGSAGSRRSRRPRHHRAAIAAAEPSAAAPWNPSRPNPAPPEPRAPAEPRRHRNRRADSRTGAAADPPGSAAAAGKTALRPDRPVPARPKTAVTARPPVTHPAPSPAAPAATPPGGPPAPASVAAMSLIPPRPVAGMESNRPPRYPETARRRGDQGRVIVRVERLGRWRAADPEHRPQQRLHGAGRGGFVRGPAVAFRARQPGRPPGCRGGAGAYCVPAGELSRSEGRNLRLAGPCLAGASRHRRGGDPVAGAVVGPDPTLG